MKVKVTIKATVFLEYSDEEKEISAVVDKEVADNVIGNFVPANFGKVKSPLFGG